MLGFDGKVLSQLPKMQILTVVIQNCETSSVKYFIEKPMLFNFMDCLQYFFYGCNQPANCQNKFLKISSILNVSAVNSLYHKINILEVCCFLIPYTLVSLSITIRYTIRWLYNHRIINMTLLHLFLFHSSYLGNFGRVFYKSNNYNNISCW